MYNINQIKKITEPIAKTYDIDKVWLFGSYARGEQTEESRQRRAILISGLIAEMCALAYDWVHFTQI